MTSNIIFQICQQKKKKIIYNIPPTRQEIVSSPYEIGFTKTQLDMRRKVEILKYSSNLQSTQTNNLTKKEKFALLMKGNYRQLPNLNNTCLNDDLIPTPTSSSDIPGPIINIYYDKDVPLYNFMNDINTRSYSSIQKDIDEPWSIYDNSNVTYNTNNGITSYNGDYNTCCTLYFRNIINQLRLRDYVLVKNY